MVGVKEKESFAQEVRSRRKALGLSQKELAYCAGCSIKTIEKIESGERRPSRQVAELVAHCLGLGELERPAFMALSREPLAIASAHTTTPNNLPAPATAFVGREKEVMEGSRLLRNEDVRLLTFSGPPGIGKTRLSLRVASQVLAAFPDGAYFVPLATVRDPEMVPTAIAHTLKVQSVSGQSDLELLQDYLRNRRLLLVLDNFEQVVEGGPAVGALLTYAPGLKVATSSREPLHLYGEYEFPVPPLSLPDISNLPPLEELTRYEGIRLFAQRAQAANRAFELTRENAAQVAAICARLDGLALAIELAAAQIREYTPAEIVQRLEPSLDLLVGGPRDLPARQQTLRAAIAWSHDLLGEEEQEIFCRLSVFAGANAKAIAKLSNQKPEVRNQEALLESLVDKSLLRREGRGGDSRYWMLETIRDYAAEKLGEGGKKEETERRHAAYYLSVAQEGNTQIRGPHSARWLGDLETEHDNMRLALRRSLDSGDSATALRLASALRWFWYLRGYVAEGRRWLDEALAAGKDPTPERADALTALGVLAERLGDYEGAKAALTESVGLWRSLGDTPGTARALHNLAGVALEHNEYDRAEKLYGESLELWRSLGDVRNMAATLHNLSIIVYSRGDYDRALEMCREALPLMEATGDWTFVGRLLTGMGEILRLKGDYEEAGQYYRRSIELADRLGDRKGRSIVLVNLGYVERRIGKIDLAEEYTREALGLDLEAGDSASVAQDLIALGGVAGSRGQAEKAARLFAAADTLMSNLAVTLATPDRIEYERDLDAVMAQLSEPEWAKLQQEGRTMSPDQAVEYALSTGAQV